MTDTELINLLENDPDAGYEKMIDQYGGLVYAVVLNRLRGISSKEDIEDCVSDIFVEIFRNTDRFDMSAGSLKAFIGTLAKRRAVDEYRRLLKHYTRSVSIDENSEDLMISDITPEQTNEEKAEKQFIWKTIKELGEPDSIILIQQFFYEKTAKEIGKMLSMTAAAVHKRSTRARERLKKQMHENGIAY